MQLIMLLKLRYPQLVVLSTKKDHDAKISEIEAKYFTTSDCNKYTGEIFDRKIKEKDLVDKSDNPGFICELGKKTAKASL